MLSILMLMGSPFKLPLLPLGNVGPELAMAEQALTNPNTPHLSNCTRRVSETGAQDKPKPGDPYLDTTCLSHPCLNTPSNALYSLSRVRALSVPSLNATWPCLTHPD